MPRRELTETDIRNVVRTLIDPLIVKFREQIFGSGISFSPKISVTVIPDSFGELSDSNPQSITDSTNSPGSSDKSSRDDHTHSHGNRGGGSLHSYATTGVPGFTTLAALGATTSGTVVQAQDTRLSNARTPSGAASGDLSGSYPNPTVVKLQGNSISSISPSEGQSLVWSAGQWQPLAVSGNSSSSNSSGLVLLSSVLLTSAQSTIDFTLISSGYTHLMVVGDVRTSEATTQSQIAFRINSDSGNNYDWTREYFGTGGTGSSGSAGDSRAALGFYPGSTATSGFSSSFKIWIPNYKNTNFQKTYMSEGITRPNTTLTNLYMIKYYGAWRSTAVITSLSFHVIAGSNYEIGSVISLYGMA